MRLSIPTTCVRLFVFVLIGYSRELVPDMYGMIRDDRYQRCSRFLRNGKSIVDILCIALAPSHHSGKMNT